jgi:ABC-type branched-subunit amino acid transport system ATPase component
MTNDALEVRDVSLRFGGIHALSEVSVSVQPGEIFGIIGPNGAGKTTLLNVMSGIYRPDSGSVFLNGVDATGKSLHRVARYGVARTFQQPSLLTSETVWTNVLLGRQLHLRRGVISNMIYWGGTRREERSHGMIAENALAMTGISHLKNRVVSSLPHGALRLVELARAMVMESKVLLLDEPASGMTLEERQEIASVLQRIRAEVGTAQVLIEHNVNFVSSLCDRILVLNFGQVIARGIPDEVLADPQVSLVFLGH